MDFVFRNKRINGILTVLPQRAISFEDEMKNYNFSPIKCMKLKMILMLCFSFHSLQTIIYHLQAI